jgi:hypothetical protein
MASLTASALTSTAAELRGVGLDRVAASFTATSSAEALVPLRDAGYLEFDPPPGAEVALGELVLTDAYVVVISGARADVAAADLALPFVSELTERGSRVLAVEPSAPVAVDDEEPPPPGVAMAVRAEDDVAGQVATVDNVDDYRGRVAAVFALAELRDGRSGHFGTGDGAQRLLPEPVG